MLKEKEQRLLPELPAKLKNGRRKNDVRRKKNRPGCARSTNLRQKKRNAKKLLPLQRGVYSSSRCRYFTEHV